MDPQVKNLLIVYHSQSGRNEQLAYAAKAGVLRVESGIELKVLRAAEAGTRDLLWCDGVLFFMPEYFGALCGGIKDLLDRCFYPGLANELHCAYGVHMCTGNDGSSALRQLQKILQAFPMSCAIEPVVIYGGPQSRDLLQAEELGEAFATGLQLGLF